MSPFKAGQTVRHIDGAEGLVLSWNDEKNFGMVQFGANTEAIPCDPSVLRPVEYAKALAIAIVCHEANRAYCISIGDMSQPLWSAAPAWQRTSAINGVQFHLDNPGTKPERSHESWLAEKAADGWKFGAVKDPVLKTHPCFVPYAELPEEQQRKDALFSAIVEALR